MTSLQLSGCGLVVVAHPDDEVLWAGGTILSHINVQWCVVSLCRGSDPDRNPRFFRVAAELDALAVIGDMDDGPDQEPLPGELVEATLRSLLPQRRFDLVITHSPYGEYTRHRRHEETSRAVQSMWRKEEIESPLLWLFAYQDSQRQHPPRAIQSAHRLITLDGETFAKKQQLITQVYGFDPDGFEGQATSDLEAFWEFPSVTDLDLWLTQGEPARENSAAL